MPDGINVAPERPKQDAPPADPIRELLARLNRDAATVAAKDPDLSRTIGQLAEASTRPGNTEDPVLRTKAAYALQDFEKLAGPISTAPAGLRDEMTRLAATAPGLQNERLQELVRQTPTVSDRRLVSDIRDLALNIGAQGGDQNRQDVRDKVEALENRVRLAAGTAATLGAKASHANSAGAQPSAPEAARQPDRSTDSRRPRQAPNSDNGPAPGQAQTSEASSRAVPPTPPQTPQRSPGQDEPSAGAAAPTWGRPQAPQPGSTQQPTQETQTNQTTARGPGALSIALGALASRWASSNAEGTPDRPPSPIADRAARHEQQSQGSRDDTTVSAAEKSQAAALTAVRDFANGPASNILTKIQDAAKSEPGGMAAVLAEMREGGRFAGLRTQLNADISTERGAAAAYDRMTGALAQYGTDRAAVEAVGVRNNSAAVLTAKFEKVDAEIGKAVSMLPSKSDGKSVMDDLGDKLKQVLDRAVEAVKSAFTPSAERAARSSASPSPAP